MAREKASGSKKSRTASKNGRSGTRGSTRRGADDRYFMPNLSAAIADEYKKRSRAGAASELPGLPSPEDSTIAYEVVEDGNMAQRADSVPSAAEDGAPRPGPARTRAAAKAAAKQAAEQKAALEVQKAKILKELRSIIGKLDVESLSTILEEAHVALYNMEAERINALADEREKQAAKAAGPASIPEEESPAVRIDRSSSGDSYYIGYRNAYPMFSSREMLAMVRFAFGNEDERDGARAIMRWMGQERVDALNELGGPETDLFVAIVRTMKKSFRDPRSR